MWNPNSKPYKPRPFQEQGIRMAITQACAGMMLAPGAGKTTIAYAAFKILKDHKFVNKMLVICPLKPMYNVWMRQHLTWNEFKDLKVCVLHGKDKEEKLKDDSYDIYVVNPEGLDWLFGPVVKHKPSAARLKYVKDKFQMLWVDESHKFKDTQTNRFKLMREIVPAFKRRYLGTGTFNPTGLEDLFGQVYILDEGATLGRFITHYRGKYFHQKPYDKYGYYPNVGAFEEIAEKLAPFCLVVQRHEIEGLPAVVFDDRWVDLPPAARAAYNQAEDDMLVQLEAGAIVAANAAVASGKCRQIANGFVYDANKVATRLHDEKMEDLISLVEELNGEPLIIAYEFEDDRDRILEHFKCPCISTGNAKRDDERIEEFRRGRHKIVAGSVASISLGIDGLQDVCGHIYMYGITWKLVDYIQVIDRIRRSGSSHGTVFIHRCVARDTVDERVIQRLAEREEEMVDFMELLQSLRK